MDDEELARSIERCDSQRIERVSIESNGHHSSDGYGNIARIFREDRGLVVDGQAVLNGNGRSGGVKFAQRGVDHLVGHGTRGKGRNQKKRLEKNTQENKKKRS